MGTSADAVEFAAHCHYLILNSYNLFIELYN